jgi:hypothetical protein
MIENTTLLAPPTVPAWDRLSRATGIAGLAGVVLLFVPIIALSTQGEPPFTATPEQAHAFLIQAGAAGWSDVASSTVVLAAFALLWWLTGLTLLFARAEGSPPWRSVVALASGLLLPAYLVLDVSWDAASRRAEALDPGVAAYAFDVGNLGFANIWVAMGSFALASGWLVLDTRVLGRWLGWWAVVAGAGLVLCRFFWTSEAWLAPYFLFWTWVIVVSIQLVRGRVRRGDPS